MAQWVKELVLSLQWLRLLLEYGLNPWPENFHMLQLWPKKKKKKDVMKKSFLRAFWYFCQLFLYLSCVRINGIRLPGLVHFC